MYALGGPTGRALHEERASPEMVLNRSRIGFLPLFAVAVASLGVARASVSDAEGEQGETQGWNLVWQDEFEGSVLDDESWNIVRMPDPYNNELQYYPDRPSNSKDANVQVEDGILTIEARREDFEHRQYTSARLNTKGKREFLYGRFEARMKLPAEVGLYIDDERVFVGDAPGGPAYLVGTYSVRS